MAEYTEEVLTDITLTHNGHKIVKEVTLTSKDGVEVGRSVHRYPILRDESVPAPLTAMINARKGKLPPLPRVDLPT